MLDKKLIEEKSKILACIVADFDRLSEINPVMTKQGYRQLCISLLIDRLTVDTNNEECLEIATYCFNRFKNMVESINNDILALKEYEAGQNKVAE